MTLRPLCVGLALLALPGVAHAAACDDLVQSMAAIQAALAEVEIERAQGLAQWAAGQVACQPQPVNTVVLASLFHLVGAAEAFAGATQAAEQAFARAVAVSPTAPIDPVFGEEVAAAFGKVQRRVAAEPGGTVTVLGPVEAWIDGRPVKVGLPVDLIAGTHLLQWQEEDVPVQGREIEVAPMEARQLTLGAVATLEGGARPPRPPREGSPLRTALLAGGGAGVAVGAVFLGLASATQNAFWREEDPAALEGMQARNHAFALTGAGLALLGAGSAGASFLIDGQPGFGLAWRW
jgi:hypothetical protein